MKAFLNEDFLLQTPTAQKLYHDFAAKMPIIDYHNHLVPQQSAEDKQFDNITQIWLYGDHYKWRAMRGIGVNEKYITGNATDEEKFYAWANVVPQTIRNPLFHWTHMELQKPFGIDEYLNAELKLLREQYHDIVFESKQKCSDESDTTNSRIRMSYSTSFKENVIHMIKSVGISKVALETHIPESD